MSNYSYLLKMIIIGDSTVGKTCLLLQFSDKKFKYRHDLTIGVEFGSKTLLVKEKIVKLHMWDTAGSETFLSITRSYYRGAVAALMVYDITNRKSFLNLEKWINEAKTYGKDDIVLVIIGNKGDLESSRTVSVEEGQEFADVHSMLFMETSAKEGYNVQKVFCESVALILDKIERDEFDLSNERCGIKIGESAHANLLKIRKSKCKC